MSLAVGNDESCRVPACGRAAVGYLQVGSHGRREVYVGRPRGLNQFPLCAEHLHGAGTAPAPRPRRHLYSS
jgi:hypothetical protein